MEYKFWGTPIVSSPTSYPVSKVHKIHLNTFRMYYLGGSSSRTSKSESSNHYQSGWWRFNCSDCGHHTWSDGFAVFGRYCDYVLQRNTQKTNSSRYSHAQLQWRGQYFAIFNLQHSKSYSQYWIRSYLKIAKSIPKSIILKIIWIKSTGIYAKMHLESISLCE